MAPAILNFFPSPKPQISSVIPQHICTYCFLLMVCFNHFHFLGNSDLHPWKVSVVPWIQIDLDDPPLCFIAPLVFRCIFMHATCLYLCVTPFGWNAILWWPLAYHLWRKTIISVGSNKISVKFFIGQACDRSLTLEPGTEIQPLEPFWRMCGKMFPKGTFILLSRKDERQTLEGTK